MKFLSAPKFFPQSDYSNDGVQETEASHVPATEKGVANHDLHYISWDNPPKQHPHFLTVNDYQRMIESNAHFERKFGCNETIPDKIDSELLDCAPNGFVPGGWFTNGDT
ncbi:hypothetical protein IFM89_031893 [Coptis chinensis]|uniref:Uncharacterized protein n=1 Tax=Coptis chinensis TaxID=261450 RepID=A0A835IRY2_9MAGN|nr:hypothetical protein IFM89_031893 [Coptis chinensis]